VKYAWIQAHQQADPLQSMCEQLSVSSSGYADWKRCGGPRNWPSEDQLLGLIRVVHAESKQAYGSPRITQEIKARGVPTSKDRVRRLMKAHGIRGRHKHKFKATTNSDHRLPVASNLLEQDFTARAPGQTWVVDMTYIPTREGWLYLATVLDVYTRMIVGWAMDDRMTRELTINALKMAYWRRKPKPGLIHHSDRGSQYCSRDYRQLLDGYGMKASMSRKGCCWDNAMMESFYNSLKNERVFHQDYATREQAKIDLLEYIEGFYNSVRRHSGLGYRSPAQHYAAWVAQQKLAA
jgi:putative transposase